MPSICVKGHFVERYHPNTHTHTHTLQTDCFTRTTKWQTDRQTAKRPLLHNNLHKPVSHNCWTLWALDHHPQIQFCGSDSVCLLTLRALQMFVLLWFRDIVNGPLYYCWTLTLILTESNNPRRGPTIMTPGFTNFKVVGPGRGFIRRGVQ